MTGLTVISDRSPLRDLSINCKNIDGQPMPDKDIPYITLPEGMVMEGRANRILLSDIASLPFSQGMEILKTYRLSREIFTGFPQYSLIQHNHLSDRWIIKFILEIAEFHEVPVISVLEMQGFIDREDYSYFVNGLLTAGLEKAVALNLDKFEGLNSEVAIALIETHQDIAVARNLDKFEGLNASVAIALIKKGCGWYVARNLDKFEGLDHNAIARELIDKGQGGELAWITAMLEGLDFEVSYKLIEEGWHWAVALNLDKFEGLNVSVAIALIMKGCGGAVVQNLEKFEGLDFEVANQLILSGYKEVVLNNWVCFFNIEGNNELLIELLNSEGKDSSLIIRIQEFFSENENLEEINFFKNLLFNFFNKPLKVQEEIGHYLEHHRGSEKLLKILTHFGYLEFIFDYLGKFHINSENLENISDFILEKSIYIPLMFSDDEIFSEYKCSIYGLVSMDIVKVSWLTLDGTENHRYYDRTAIHESLSTDGRDPITRNSLSTDDLEECPEEIEIIKSHFKELLMQHLQGL